MPELRKLHRQSGTMDALILYVAPGFLACVWLEWWLGRRRHPERYARDDTLASLAMGLGSALLGVAYKAALLALWFVLYEHRLFEIGHGPWAWLALFFADDFFYYWAHRASHEVRFMWAGHVSHHSSLQYHFATALRQSWTQPLTTFVFWLPLPLLGFHPAMVLTQQAVSLIYQFFIHTESVKRLGPLEWVLNTPSHHRVHHAVNTRYLDRNHGGILIIWDRLFGTFADEREDEPPVYGITRNIHTYNPVRIAFHEWVALARAVRTARGLRHKLALVFRPPGFSRDGSTLTAAQMRAREGL